MGTFKLTFMCVAASFLTVSCTETIDLNNNDYETNGIQFTMASDIVQSRGLPVLSSGDIPDMGVFAYYTGDGAANNWAAQGASATPGYMNNIQITNNGGVWSYDDPVYWPHAADANVSFFAYSPYATADNGIIMNVTTSIPSITYTVPENCSNQPDLMVSSLLQDRNKTNNGSSAVNFQMRHVLTCIGFKASGNGEKIEKITVNGIKTSGKLTIAADGTPSWDLSGAVAGNFDATVDDGVYLGAMAELVNTGGGYLMMVPQTLEQGASLTVKLNTGRSFDFDLDGLTWGTGQFINYTLSITPEAALLLTPEKIVLPPMGGFSEFNVIVANGSSLDWTIAISNSDFRICDNLPDILGWANGTISAADVRNLDGSTPAATNQFTGTGSKTLYVWKPTANPSVSNEITGTISNVIDPTGVSINVIQLPDYSMSTVRDSYMAGEYVGAFWKANQKGERIIRIPVINILRAGDWDASVFWLGPGWKAGDIVFSNDESEDQEITFNSTTENPANMLTHDATYIVPGYVSSASGNVVSGAGNFLHFRIGLTSTYTATAASPARYALVLLRYGSPQKYHIIYLRQGEGDDYLMDPADNIRGSAAVRFSPYNATASDLTDSDEFVEILPNRSNSVFTDYPSQAGAFFQWDNIPYGPLAYHPVKPITPIIWNNVVTGGYWNSISTSQESCPPGYHRPDDGTTTTAIANSTISVIGNSQMRQSLYATPTVNTNSSLANARWGFYADGFFDRRDHNNPFVPSPGKGGSAIASNTAVSWQTKNVAYIGTLLFNPVVGSQRENASLFFPAAGDRHSEGGILIEGGEAGIILSSSAPNVNDMWYLVATPTLGIQQLFSTRSHALSLRCVPN